MARGIYDYHDYILNIEGINRTHRNAYRRCRLPVQRRVIHYAKGEYLVQSRSAQRKACINSFADPRVC
jgi:hypothetical protein